MAKKKLIRRNLSLNIEYSETTELKGILKRMLFQIDNGSRYEREATEDHLIEWSIETLELMNYREELINGQWCQVYPSKMNNEFTYKNHKNANER